METPLTPLDFMRRARKLYGRREAVVDGDLRLTYEQFFDRCDRWSSALQRLGVRKGDRVAYIAPNTHAQLESFYAVPQLGAVLVPINYRLTADDFAYIIDHSGASVVCVHGDYLDAVDSIRDRIPKVRAFRRAGGRARRLDRLRERDRRRVARLHQAEDRRGRPADDQLHQRHDLAAQGRHDHPPQRLHERRRHAASTLPMSPADRYLWTLPMFHANGWTFTWIVTAAGATHVCLRKVDPAEIFSLIGRENVTMLCAAPTVLIGIANAPEELRRRRQARRARADGRRAARRGDHRAHRRRARLGHHCRSTASPRPRRSSPSASRCPSTTALQPFERATIKARQGVELITSGELTRRGRGGQRGAARRPDARRDRRARQRRHAGLLQRPAGHRQRHPRRLVPHRRRGVVHPDGYVEIRDRIKDVIISGGENISSVEVEGALLRHPAVQEVAVVGMKDEQWGESPHAFVVLQARRDRAPPRSYASSRASTWRTSRCPRAFNFVQELPKTATGKIQKYVLRGGQAAIARQ